jgi:hypothetical protein
MQAQYVNHKAVRFVETTWSKTKFAVTGFEVRSLQEMHVGSMFDEERHMVGRLT